VRRRKRGEKERSQRGSPRLTNPSQRTPLPPSRLIWSLLIPSSWPTTFKSCMRS
jgi:hypothetical protein